MSINWDMEPQLRVTGVSEGEELLELSVLPVPLKFEGVVSPLAFSHLLLHVSFLLYVNSLLSKIQICRNGYMSTKIE